MAHGERAARQGAWSRGKEHWTARPLATSVGGRHHADDTKARSHRIERARGRAELRLLRAEEDPWDSKEAEESRLWGRLYADRSLYAECFYD